MKFHTNQLRYKSMTEWQENRLFDADLQPSYSI